MADDPNVGDFIVLFESDSDNAQQPPILLRVAEQGYEGIGEAWIEQADLIEARARFLAHEAGMAACWRWVHVVPAEPT